MAPLYLAVVSWCERLDKLVFDTELITGFFKERDAVRSRRIQSVSELRAVISLYALDDVWELFHAML